MVAGIHFLWDEGYGVPLNQDPQFRSSYMVDMAQLVSAPDCGSGGRGFESHYPPFLWVTSSVGRALDF